jgi:protoporphyrinogen oxidase
MTTLNSSDHALLQAAVRFNLRIGIVICGVLTGAGLWLATVYLLLKDGEEVGAHLGLLAAIFPGYAVTWSGAWVGFFWGFVLGALSSGVIFSSYARNMRSELIDSVLDTPTGQPYRSPTLIVAGHSFGLAVGLLAMLQLMLATNWLVVRGAGVAIENAALLGEFLPGYTVTPIGSLIGGIQVFLLAYLAARAVASLYNRIARIDTPVRIAKLRAAEPPVRPMHVVILGAGPAGLATGHELVENSERVTVLEQNPYVGGLCRTIEDSGYKFDLGGHRWFTKNEDLNNWFRRVMEGELVLVERISRIYYGGKYYMYPVGLKDVLRNAGVMTLIRAGFSYIGSSIRYGAFSQPIRNMKDGYVAQFGSTLYEMFFRRYSEKVWGSPCEELSADWVGQRSKGLSIWTVAREALASRKSGVRSLIEEFMYPRDGYMRIPERMADTISKAGNEIILGATVTRVEYRGPNNFEVFFATQAGERSVHATHVVSTIPLSALAQMTVPRADAAVVKAARSLRFRDLVTVNVKLKRAQVTPDTWLYVQDTNIIFGRLHEPKNWSAAMVPDAAHTSLVLECFCTVGDAIWSRSDDEIAARCVADLEQKLGFIAKSEVVGWNVVRTRNAYPIYDLDYLANLGVIKAHLEAFPGLSIVGRGGAFRYNNADHSIEMGLLLARRILGYDVDPLDVNTEAEYHEEVRSDQIARDHYQVRATSTERVPS